ncbi:transposase [Hydrogenibacillus schlegelii]|uniref:transposase n=3 Tax=Hydrogenibacillus schlegelii TaxID=1484 RepID=UPI002480F351|nr:transposase [Hydrogenibacillus schlegelii]
MTCVWPEKRLLTLLPDDRLRTLEAFLKRLPESVRKKIRAVTIDLKESWKKLIQRVLPEARVVADPFHGLREGSRRVDETRRVERRTGHRLPRWPLLKNEEDLTERQAKELATIRQHFRNVAQFHWVKEQLRDLYRAASLEEAKAILDRILFEAEGASDAALVQWGRTLKRWKNEILTYHTWRTTNGYTEGVHTKIKLLKRISYGFKNREVYVRKMLLAFVPLALLIA